MTKIKTFGLPVKHNPAVRPIFMLERQTNVRNVASGIAHVPRSLWSNGNCVAFSPYAARPFLSSSLLPSADAAYARIGFSSWVGFASRNG